MQRQAVPLMNPESPIVGTGMEYVSAKDSGAVICKHPGVVERVEAREVWVRRYVEVDGQTVKGDLDRYKMQNSFVLTKNLLQPTSNRKCWK